MIEYSPQGEFDPDSGRIARGLIDITLTVNEPLLTTPFLSLVPDGGLPISIELNPVSDTQYQGQFEITENTPEGTAYAVFSARDQAGNRGTEIDSGTQIEIDSQGPKVTLLTLFPNEPIRNDANNPVSLQVTLELDEALPAEQIPELSYRLSGSQIQALQLSQTEQNWSANFSLPADAGLSETENLQFYFSAEDDLHNRGTEIVGDSQFQIYQGDLPPLLVPFGLKAVALPNGKIQLNWKAVTGASDYQVFRKAPGESQLTPYQRSSGTLELTDNTQQDGLYHYAIASVRQANEQESFSANSTVVKVTADSLAPQAPTGLQLELIGAGIRVTWQAPSGYEKITYQVYREASEIQSLDGLTPLKTDIKELGVIDGKPDKTQPYYTVIAVDAAGNQSALSETAYLNIDLLPVATLEVVQDGNNPPIVTWSHPASAELSGFDIYIGPETERVKVNDTLLSETRYTDNDWASQERFYTIVAIDPNAVESLERTVRLPLLTAQLEKTNIYITRALFNTLAYQVTNHENDLVRNIQVQIQLGDHSAHSATFSLLGSETREIPVVIGGYADLADLSTLTTTLHIQPDTGEVARLIQHQEVEIADGGGLTVSLQTQKLTRGGEGQVKFSVENTSAVDIELVTATAQGDFSDELQFLLADSDENVLTVQAFKQVLGQHIITLPNGKTVARIPAGKRFDSDWIDLAVPASAPNQVKLQFKIDQIHYHLGQEDALSLAGITRFQNVSLVDTAYYGELTTITPATSYGKEPIVITGKAIERSTNQAMPLVPLQLVITLKGFERDYQVYTDENGTFSYQFKPLDNESGHYHLSVLHPDLTERPEQGEFVIQRIALQGGGDYSVDLRIPFNYEQRIEVLIFAGEATEEHNIHLVYEALDQTLGEFPEGIEVTLGQPLAVLTASEKAQLNFSITADNTAAPTGTLILRVMSDEHADTPIGLILVNYQFSEALPALFYTPNFLETGVGLDDSVSEKITLENKGLESLFGLKLALLKADGSRPAPSWIYLTTQPEIGTLAVGETSEVHLMASPNAQVSEGLYELVLRATSDNHPTRDINLFVAVTQSGLGNVLFKIEDIYTATLDEDGNVIEGLAGAKVRVQNEKVLTVDETLISDDSGEAYFENLPAGRYKFKATAQSHQEVIGRFWIKPGITVSEQVFLDYNLVTVEWSVTEITLEDRYEINLEATYETDVPAAVVIIEPLSVNLPEMAIGEVYSGEFSLTNHGLIRADNLKFELPEDDQYFKYDWLAELPDTLAAHQQISIPYRLTALTSLDQSGENTGGGCQSYSQTSTASYSYDCANGSTSSGSTSSTFHSSCSSGGASGPRSEDYYYSSGGGAYGGGKGGYGSGSPSYSSLGGGGNDCESGGPDRERNQCADDTADQNQPVGSSISLTQTEFNDQVTDLRVKVPGGLIALERQFFDGRWSRYPIDSHIRYGSVIKSATNYGATNLGGFPEGIKSLILMGVSYQYEPPDNRDENVPLNAVYVNESAKIIRFPRFSNKGYRWQNKFGDWMTFDNEGHLLRFGTRQGTLGKLLYQNLDSGQLVIGVADRFDKQVLWVGYQADGITTVRDELNRQVKYQYRIGDLKKVVDVLGQETHYAYERRTVFLNNKEEGEISSDGVYLAGARKGQTRGNIAPPPPTEIKIILVEKREPSGQVTHIGYDFKARPSQVRDANGEERFVFEYGYDSTRKEYYRQMTTASGMVKEIWFDKKGKTTRVDINGRTVKTLSQSERSLKITDGKGNVTLKQYDEWKNVVAIRYPDNTQVSFEYEYRYHRPIRLTDRLGNVTTYEYDESGNLLRKTQAVETPAERITTFTYDDQNQLMTLTQKGDANTESATISFSYDSNGNIASITDANAHRLEVMEYDIAGNPLKIKDYLGFIWHYDYDADERLKSVTDPLNQTTSYEYDAVGNLTAVVDEADNRWTFAYNLSDKLTQVVNPLQHNKKLLYNLDLRPIQVIDEEGKSHYSSYDNEGRLLTAIDGAGNEIVHHYDETPSNPVDSRVPVKIEFPTYSQLLSFDRLLRLTGITEVLDDNTRYSSHYEYDVGGNLTSYTDQQDNSTGYEYDALGRLIQITDALEGVTRYSYDARSNVIAITDANQNVTRYEYDKNNNLVKIIRPNEEATQYEYDAADNQTVKIDPQGQKVAYQYDELSRLTRVDYYAADAHTQPVKTVRLTYDIVGNLLSIEDGTTSAAYTYDALGRQKTETVNYGPFSLNYAYEYYANGLKKSFTGPSGKKVTYSYDDNNRLSAIDIPNAGRITYNQYHWNSPAKITLPGGSQVNLDYDPVMRLQSKVVKDPLKQVLMNYQYEYSPTDSLTKKITEHGEYRYEYDKLYRLLKATNPVLDDEHYTYDPLGNRLTASQVTEESSYDANNALLSDNGAAFEYLNHNLVKKTKGNQVTDYGYNIENRLSEVKEDNTSLANYGYDPFGRRLWKEVEGVKTYFLYSDEGLVGEYDENGVEIKGYGYLPDSFWTSDPLFQTQNGSYYWYQNDQLGTPQKLTDSQGNIVWEAHYKAFGEAQVETDLVDNPLRFPGQYFDTETELHYNYQRDYDPSTGRYLQFDPIGLEGGLNGYLYAHSDPVNLYDPTGEIAPLIGIAATQYARCLAACAATNVIANAIGGSACGFVENNCWSSCLNPLNWGGRRPKLGKPRKSSPPESCSLPNSFSAGTLVHTEEGLKPIEKIKIGEKVLSMDENTGKTSYQLVTDLIQGEGQYRLVEITLDSGKSIEATADHPFYIKGKGWNSASSLKVGQVLELHNGTTVVVEEVLTRVRRDLVYNLTVANTHNYFVGEDGVLVHNADRIDPKLDSKLDKLAGPKDAKKFRSAVKKGIVGPYGQSGIKKLNPPEGHYTHEIKIGKSANRVLGYPDDEGLLFCKYKRGGLH